MSDKIFIATVASAILAQIVKTIVDTAQNGKFHWQSFFRGAGMPSSHTATVVALSLSIFMTEKVTHLFLVTLFFSILVIRDVIGDKVFAIHQENIINKLVQQMISHHKVEWQHLMGHSFSEVIAGLILGIAVTLLVFAKF